MNNEQHSFQTQSFKCVYLTTLLITTIIQRLWYNNQYPALVEWCWQQKTEALRGQYVTVSLCQSQIPYGLGRDRTVGYVVTGRWLFTSYITVGTSQWPSGLKRGSAAARLLGLRVRIPPWAWMFMCCECCVLLGSLCDGLITRPEESYRLWCVSCLWSRNLKNEEAKTRKWVVKASTEEEEEEEEEEEDNSRNSEHDTGWTTEEFGFDSWQRQGILLSPKRPGHRLWVPAHSPVQYLPVALTPQIKRSEREADHWPEHG